LVSVAQASEAAEKTLHFCSAGSEPAILAIREIYLLAPGSRILPSSLFGSRSGPSLRPQAGLGINSPSEQVRGPAPKQNAQSTRRRPRNFVCQNPATDFIQPKFFSINFRFA